MEKTLKAMAFDHLLHVPMEVVEKLDDRLKQFAVKPDQSPDMIMDI